MEMNYPTILFKHLTWSWGNSFFFYCYWHSKKRVRCPKLEKSIKLHKPVLNSFCFILFVDNTRRERSNTIAEKCVTQNWNPGSKTYIRSFNIHLVTLVRRPRNTSALYIFTCPLDNIYIMFRRNFRSVVCNQDWRKLSVYYSYFRHT